MARRIEKSGAFTPKHTVLAFVASLDVKAGTANLYQIAVSVLDDYLGRPAKLSDLTEVVLGDFSEWLEVTPGLSASTKDGYRMRLSVIANHAAELEIIPLVLLDNEARGYSYEVGADPSRWGLRRYFEDVYLIDRQSGDSPLTPETVKAYRAAVAAFLRHTTAPPTVHNVNAAAVRAFRAWLVAHGMNKKKAGNHAFAVASIVKHAKPERFLEEAEALTPAANIERTLAYVFEKSYLPAKQTIASQKTVAKYLATFNSFGRFLGRIATLDDLTDQNVGGFMRQCSANGNAARTTNGYRSKLIAFWTWCAKRRLVHDFPTIEKMPEPAILPTARSLDELKKLMAGCDRMPGTVAGIPASRWWRLLHLVDWDTMGERTGALLELRWEWLDWDTGHLSIPAQYRKGGRKPNLCKIKPSTLRELRDFQLPERELIFPWDRCHSAFYQHYKRLLRLAGLPYVKYKSAIQMHRRTFATHLEMIGGDATEALRHSERSITTDSYIDPKLLNRAPANEALFALADVS